MVDNFHRIMRADANVLQTLLADSLEQGAHARLVYFATKETGVWQDSGNVCGSLTHAKADFQHKCLSFCPGIKNAVNVQGFLLECDEIAWTECIECLGLADGGPAGTLYETSHRAHERPLGRVFFGLDGGRGDRRV
jgi:hypothetical protein